MAFSVVQLAKAAAVAAARMGGLNAATKANLNLDLNAKRRLGHMCMANSFRPNPANNPGNNPGLRLSPGLRVREDGWAKSSRCGISNLHTKGDQELVQFLVEEIAAETKVQKSSKVPDLAGFDVKTSGSNITLTKNFNNERVTVKFNINHTVDSDPPEAEVNMTQDKPELGDMKSKPNFTVEINKAGKVLGFTCSFVQDFETEDKAGDADSFSDIFNIDEVVMHDGDWSESIYAVSGEIIDGYLYDLLMNMLEERGISTEFAESLIEFSTSYEHKQYINLLENLKSFVGGK